MASAPSSPGSSPENVQDKLPEAQEKSSGSTSGKEEQLANDTKERTTDSSGSSPAPSFAAPASSSTPWQAIYSPEYNAYYFYNSETQQTTWENPLVPSSSTPTDPSSSASTEYSITNAEPSSSSSICSTSSPASSYNALEAAAIAQGIDPSLAYLDPSLVATGPGAGISTARFNARTGQFARADARDPSHLSEYERMKRMSEFYFDVNAWEKQKIEDQDEEDEAGGGKKRKRPSKKDVERFKEQKRLKKIAKTAWLRT
ncbi:hypothetical protein E1B28_006741 [Marasmius oreades]|uniref:WW domain-containing protein n=1 Tax=Marasmius oreades TaxID=181124 RepID=A0A9P8ABA1_9AGAR|nr:uncharacterized protein E1B28_006741 [Marasmius oreades]KAG7096060.1 hypothetical protein E1B28_006741 [Marasmius oreades]